MLAKLFSFIPFYLLGTFPTGRLLARQRGVALEEHGSGNIGATNVARTLGKKAGLITLAGDIAKGAAAVFLAKLLMDDTNYPAWAAFMVVAGHCFSLPGIWKGGKGVATALGAYLALLPLTALLGVVSFMLLLAASRMVSLSSVCTALLLPVYALLLSEQPLGGLIPLCGISLLVVYRHQENLKRIIEGSEPRIGASRQLDQESSTLKTKS